jgi:outer membrane immunogenic protein
MATRLTAVLFLTCFSLAAAAQEAKTPRFEVSGGYIYVHANAPPGECGCFPLNGGNVSGAYNLTRLIGIVGDLAVVHNGNVDGSNTGVTLTSYTFGPQFSLRTSNRLTPFGQILIGGAHESAGPASASAFAMNLGGGVDLGLHPHWSIRLLEADYYLTLFPNAMNSRQNNLRIGTGIVFKF